METLSIKGFKLLSGQGLDVQGHCDHLWMMVIHDTKCVNLGTVHSTRIPHFPQNSEENLSFARKPTEDIIYVIYKIPRSSAELINFLGGKLER